MRKFFRTLLNILLFPFRLIGRFFRSISRFIKTTFSKIKSFFTEEPEDTPLGEAFAKSVKDPTGVFFHLNELRKNIFRGAVAFVIATALSFTFAQTILGYLAIPAGGLKELVAIDVTEPMAILMRISLLSGFVISLPIIIFEIYLFVAPGLTIRSRKIGLLVIPILFGLFLLGMAFAFFVMLPRAVPFMTSILGLETQLRPSTYYSFVTSVLFWIGISFEFPVVIYILAKLGIVNAQTLKRQWRIAIVIIAIIAAMITPTVDPINMGLIMGPLIIIYFFSIFLAVIAQRGRERS
jgi:sec-independent protein translocase protein TatC